MSGLNETEILEVLRAHWSFTWFEYDNGAAGVCCENCEFEEATELDEQEWGFRHIAKKLLEVANQPNRRTRVNDSRVEVVQTGNPAVSLLACRECGVLIWNIDAHYNDAHKPTKQESCHE